MNSGVGSCVFIHDLQLTTEICVLRIIFCSLEQNLVSFARFVCVADHFCSLKQNLVGFARIFFCVVDHFCSLKQWVGMMSFLADFCDGSQTINTIWFCREDGGCLDGCMFWLMIIFGHVILELYVDVCYKHKIVFGQNFVL
jgi:hypothetical protein